jgi:RNA polymerase sigma factor (sigma-70 family)
MNTKSDQDLLRDYAGHRSEAAFAELVRRHVDLVYSVAFRMVRDAHLAEDVAQNVFIAFANNARKLKERAVLCGWLHNTTRNLAANAVRSEVRRRAREQEAATMNELLGSSADASWAEIAPLLDAALGDLGEPDRDAVLLRYFQRQNMQEIALALGVSEEAAKKRVQRALERLRDHLNKRNVSTAAGALALIISANAVQSAPAGLAASISGSACLLGGAAHTSSLAIAGKAAALTSFQKGVLTAMLATIATVGIVELHKLATSKHTEGLTGEVLASVTASSNAQAPGSQASVPSEAAIAREARLSDADKELLKTVGNSVEGKTTNASNQFNVAGQEEIRVFRLRHAEPQAVADKLSTLFPPSSKQKSTVVALADDRTESVVVTAPHDLMPEIKVVIEGLDNQTPKVGNAPLTEYDLARAKEELNTALAEIAPDKPLPPQLLVQRAHIEARTGKWPEAAGDLKQALQLTPGNAWVSYLLSSALLQSGQLGEYQEHSHEMMLRFRNSHTQVAAGRTAEAYLVAPYGDKDDLEMSVELVEKKVFRWWREFYKGLAEYRLDHFSDASDSLEHDIKQLDTVNQVDRPPCEADCYLVLAMARRRLNQVPEARAALAHGREVAQTKIPQLEAPDLGPYWWNGVTTRVLLKEAQETVEGLASSSGNARPPASLTFSMPGTAVTPAAAGKGIFVVSGPFFEPPQGDLAVVPGSVKMADGQLHFVVSGVTPGATIYTQASSDLSTPRSWIPIATNRADATAVTVGGTSTTNAQFQFFRILETQ